MAESKEIDIEQCYRNIAENLEALSRSKHKFCPIKLQLQRMLDDKDKHKPVSGFECTFYCGCVIVGNDDPDFCTRTVSFDETYIKSICMWTRFGKPVILIVGREQKWVTCRDHTGIWSRESGISLSCSPCMTWDIKMRLDLSLEPSLEDDDMTTIVVCGTDFSSFASAFARSMTFSLTEKPGFFPSDMVEFMDKFEEIEKRIDKHGAEWLTLRNHNVKLESFLLQ